MTLITVSAISARGGHGDGSWIDDLSSHTASTVLASLGLPAAVAFLLLLFGGLPLAVFGLLFDRQWTGVSRPNDALCDCRTALLMFQIVSMGLSAFGLAMMGDASCGPL